MTTNSDDNTQDWDTWRVARFAAGTFQAVRHSLTGLRNRAVRKRTRMLLKEEFPNGAVTELTTVRD